MMDDEHAGVALIQYFREQREKRMKENPRQ